MYMSLRVCADTLACGQIGSSKSFLICVATVLADLYDFVVAVGQGYLGVVGIDEGEEYNTSALCIESAPFLSLNVEVEAYLGAIVFTDDVIALAIAFYKVSAVLAFDNLGALATGLLPLQNSMLLRTRMSAKPETSYTGRIQNAKKTNSLTNLLPIELFQVSSLFVSLNEPMHELNIMHEHTAMTAATRIAYFFIIISIVKDE